MGFLKRLFGICATQLPTNSDCWKFADGKVEVDLAKAPELNDNFGAIRLEGGDLPFKVLLLKGNDGELHAVRNECTHGHRRLDPLSGTDKIECCSVGKSTFTYSGDLLSGSAKKSIKAFTVEVADNKATITL